MVCLLLGATVISPIYFLVNDAPVFPAQIIVVAICLAFYLLRHQVLSFSFLDQLVAVYIFWLAFSFAVNAPFMWATSKAPVAWGQFASFAIYLLTVAAYLLGRYFFRQSPDLALFRRMMLATFAGTVAYFLIFFALNSKDLYVARQSIAQRIPMMLTCVAWGLCATAFLGGKARVWRVLLWFGALAVVVFSLTRACYYQWFISGIAFTGMWLRGNIRRAVVLRLAVVAILLVSIAAASVVYLHSKDIPQFNVIYERFDQLLSFKETLNSDESASVRVEIWKRLTSRLLQSPARLVVGFGQLAPSSFLGGDFVSLSGDYISEYNAHSQYVDILMRGGIIGLLLELAIMATVIIRPLIHRRNTDPYFMAHSAALVGVLVYGIFHETLRWQMFAIYFWMYAGIVSFYFYDRPEARGSRYATSPGQNGRGYS